VCGGAVCKTPSQPIAGHSGAGQATGEAEIGRIVAQGQPMPKKTLGTLSQWKRAGHGGLCLLSLLQ
jgi:hypothetical protein